MKTQRRRRAFTLLEVMLASVLGGLVLLTCIGLFSAIRHTEVRSRERFRATIELSSTQRAIEKAMRTLVMGESPPPRPSGLPTDPSRAGRDIPGGIPEELPLDRIGARPRVLLAPVDHPPALMAYRDEQGNPHTAPPQLLEVVLMEPPVYGESGPMSEQEDPVHPAHRRAHPQDRRSWNDRRGSDHGAGGSRAGGATPLNRADAGRIAAGLNQIIGDALNNGAPDPAGADPSAVEQGMLPRAPGVRGVFELTWEPLRGSLNAGGVMVSDGSGRTGDRTGGSWTLWWRTLPNIPPPEIPGLQSVFPEPEAMAPPEPPVKLASGLRTCRWEAVRSGDTLTHVTATAWDELPAFMSLEIETSSGDWNKWMFEVSGSKGGEPGTPIEPADGVRTFGGPAQPLQPGTAPNNVPGKPDSGIPAGVPRAVPGRPVPITPSTRPGVSGAGGTVGGGVRQ